MKKEIIFKKIKYSDGEMLYDWVMDKDTRASAPDPMPFSLKSHMEWLKNKIDDVDCCIYIGFVEGEAQGQLRFQKGNDKGVNVSIVMNPLSRGKGLGRKMLKDGIDYFLNENPLELSSNHCLLKAMIKTSNLASVKIFKDSGFNYTGQTMKINTCDFYLYELHKKF